MNLLKVLPAFVCGAAAASVMLTIQTVRAQSPAPGIHACAGAEGTLRLTDSTVPCKPGERRLRITPPEPKEEQKCEDDGRVAKLERRVRDLEYRARTGTLRGRRAVAPFEVVTRKGGRLLHIEEQNVTFYNIAGKPVVWILADGSGGYLQTQSTTAGVSAAIGALDKRAHFHVQEKDRDRVDLGRRANDRYGLQVFAPGGKMVAGIGESQAGSGIVLVNDTNEGPSARVSLVADAAAQVTVMNASGTEVAFLAASKDRGAGRLQLTDGGGTLTVEAGMTDVAGVVRTGPQMHNPAVGILGLVPSFIIGKAK